MNLQRKTIPNRFIFLLLALFYALAFQPAALGQMKKEHPAASTAGHLTLENYLSQVAEKNGAYQSAAMTEEAATLRADEWTVLTSPSLIASGSYVDDQRQAASALTPTRTLTEIYSLGLQQQTRFGLQARLLYNMTNTELTYPSVAGLPANFLPEPKFTLAGPVLELTQSLWRNGFGGETRATQEVQAAQAALTRYSEAFRKSAIYAEAESTFWRLALAREAIELTRDNLGRARRIRDFNAGRARSGLSDRADVLQSDSSALTRELELEDAIDEERAAARAFNSLRGVNEDAVVEQLPPLNEDVMKSFQIPKRTEFRDDVRAAEARQRLAAATARLGSERNKPVVDVFGTVGLNGRDPRVRESVNESWTNDHPNYVVGVRMTVPLDLGTLNDSRRAYKQEATAAEVAYRRAVFENDRLWNDLTKRFNETQKRLDLARKIEVAQKEKLEYERSRHRRGRSTTFQVVQFEQDQATAQLSRILLQAEVLNILAQLKTFGSEQ